MKLSIDNVILGAGLNGLVAQMKMLDSGIQSVILEKGYAHNPAYSDYVIVAKKKLPFTDIGYIPVVTQKVSSAYGEFYSEYTRKLYGREFEMELFDDREVYPIVTSKLLDRRQIYGNVVVKKIDLANHILYGEVLHMKEEVICEYKRLFNTFPIYKFAKLCGVDLLKDLGIFIQYYPVGIKKFVRKNVTPDDIMRITYMSDPNVNFYRVHTYREFAWYEYCLNKPFDDKFTAVTYPGKFIDVKKPKKLFSYFNQFNVLNIGRYAKWDSKWVIDDTWNLDYYCWITYGEFPEEEVKDV